MLCSSRATLIFLRTSVFFDEVLKSLMSLIILYLVRIGYFVMRINLDMPNSQFGNEMFKVNRRNTRTRLEIR